MAPATLLRAFRIDDASDVSASLRTPRADTTDEDIVPTADVITPEIVLTAPDRAEKSEEASVCMPDWMAPTIVLTAPEIADDMDDTKELRALKMASLNDPTSAAT